MEFEIKSITDNPHLLEVAAEYFAARWGVSKQTYMDSMTESLNTQNPYPRWYIMMDNGNIIGGYGIIENDFMEPCGFLPWLCALYIEKDRRGQNLGVKLLDHSRRQAKELGFDHIYLNTDHVGYYEKCGWEYIGDYTHQNGEMVRVYKGLT